MGSERENLGGGEGGAGMKAREGFYERLSRRVERKMRGRGGGTG